MPDDSIDKESIDKRVEELTVITYIEDAICNYHKCPEFAERLRCYQANYPQCGYYPPKMKEESAKQ